MMDKIEFYMDEEKPLLTGWYINTYDRIGDPPVDSVGPYETKTAALRMWRDTTPNTKPNSIASEDASNTRISESEPSDAGGEDKTV